MIGYNQIKLILEVVALLSLTSVLYLTLSLTKEANHTVEGRIIGRLLAGVFVFWAGYLANVMNDIFPARILQILDDIMIATGMIIVSWLIIGLRKDLSIGVKPKKISQGDAQLRNGAYIMYKFSPERIVSLLAGRRILVLTRFPEKWKPLGVPYIWISSTGIRESIEPTRLAVIHHTLARELTPDTFVIIDSIEYLILQNGPSSILKFILSLKDHIIEQGGGLILIVDPSSLDERVLRTLAREFEELEL